MTQPLEPIPYQLRAGNRPRPADWIEPEDDHHDHVFTAKLSTQAVAPMSYFTDISEYQIPYNSQYPYQLASFRFFSGYRTDNHAHQNWNYLRSTLYPGHTRIIFAYAVFIAGQYAQAQAALVSVFGAVCPTNRLVIEIDMESGAQFAGPGNHSAEANQWAINFSRYTKTPTLIRQMPYANGPDYISCWPQLDSRLRDQKHVARYDDTPPADYYAWQYYGALSYPTPPGAPRSCPPFGAFVDLNRIPRSITQIEADFGITAPIPPIPPKPPVPPTEDDMANPVAIYSVDQATLPAGVTWPGEFAHYQYSGEYVHIEGAEKGTDNVAAICAANDMDVNKSIHKITYLQHLGYIASASH